MSGNRPPSPTERAFDCPHCGAYSQQVWFSFIASQLVEPPGVPNSYSIRQVASSLEHNIDRADDPGAETKKIDGLRNWADAVDRGDPFISSNFISVRGQKLNNLKMSICISCNRESIWICESVIYPRHTTEIAAPNDDLPDVIKRDYIEASKVISISPRSSCALLRLALQKLCEHLLNKTGNINDLIGELVKKGLSPTIQQALDSVRVIGNEAVHPGSLDLQDNVDVSYKLFILINVIAEALITQPRHIAEVYALISPSKKQAIEKRDG